MSSNIIDTDLESELTRSFLALEKIDLNIFRAPPEYLWQPLRSPFVFGGQVVGQALVSACKTVDENHHVHSLHCYFLRGGNAKKHILYHVDRTRDGRTYSTRSLKATQDAQAIFTMQASFKLDEEDVYKFQMEMPDVVGPEKLLSTKELLTQHLQTEDTTDREKDFINRMLAEEIAVEMRPVDPYAFYRRKVEKPLRYVWMKIPGHIGDDIKVHQCVAAYLSDLSLLGVTLQPGGPNFKTTFMTSLDHAIWFHKPFRVDEWMLYEISSPQCGSGRGLAHGRVWKQDGTLTMSVSQEGVVRTEALSKL